VTSYTELYRNAVACEAHNRAHPHDTPRVPYVTQALAGSSLPIVAASDYMKLLPASIAQWLPGPLVALGTDGFGLSESRTDLRRHFEVDAKSIARAALHALQRGGDLDDERLDRALAAMRPEPGSDPAGEAGAYVND